MIVAKSTMIVAKSNDEMETSCMSIVSAMVKSSAGARGGCGGSSSFGAARACTGGGGRAFGATRACTGGGGRGGGTW